MLINRIPREFVSVQRQAAQWQVSDSQSWSSRVVFGSRQKVQPVGRSWPPGHIALLHSWKWSTRQHIDWLVRSCKHLQLKITT